MVQVEEIKTLEQRRRRAKLDVTHWDQGEANLLIGVRFGRPRVRWVLSLLASGPNVPAGVDLGLIENWDFSPTICAMLGVELTNIDGRPMPAWFSVDLYL